MEALNSGNEWFADVFQLNFFGFLMLHHSMAFLKIFETEEKASVHKIFPLRCVHSAWGKGMRRGGASALPAAYAASTPEALAQEGIL